MRGILRAFLAYGNSSMLFMCSKRNEYKEVLALAAEVGRSDEVVLIDPAHHWRLDLVGYEASRKGEGAGSAVNVANFIMEQRSVIYREGDKGGGESAAWKEFDKVVIIHAGNLIKLAGEPITAVNIHKFITSTPESKNEIGSEDWKAGYCNTVIRKAFHARKTDSEGKDFEQGSTYFLDVWPKMAPNTRGSLLMGIAGTLATLTLGNARELFGTETNITPAEAIENRKLVVINMPPDCYGSEGILANCGWKWHWEKDVLRREITAESPITCIWGDESSIWISAQDSEYVSRCRSYKGCMVYLCQSRPAYQQVLPGDKADATVDALLANFTHKLFFALGDHGTAQWASDQVGKELQQFGGGSVQHQDGLFMSREQGHSSSFSEHYEPVLQTTAFMNGLRCGGPANEFMVDAVLVRSGQKFSNGLPYLNVAFDQRA